MKIYELNIKVFEPNPDYKEEKGNPLYSKMYEEREPREFERQALMVRLTEEQFDAIRKTVMEKF